MADLTSATTPSGHTVTVGQIYRSMDPRDVRHVQVLEVDGTRARISRCPGPGEPPLPPGTRTPTTQVLLAQFHSDLGRRSGYGLVQDADQLDGTRIELVAETPHPGPGKVRIEIGEPGSYWLQGEAHAALFRIVEGDSDA